MGEGEGVVEDVAANGGPGGVGADGGVAKQGAEQQAGNEADRLEVHEREDNGRQPHGEMRRHGARSKNVLQSAPEK